MNSQNFTNAGFSVIHNQHNDNPLLNFLKQHYPALIRDNELNLAALKTALGLPIDEKNNGYGLNFIGRNVALAKYQQKTDKELRLNTSLSQNLDTTQNLVLKGDNLHSLKILKNYYNGKIKCIYIDPPYNTANDNFIYPDKFDKQEAEVLGLANLDQDDLDRMEFSFQSPKNHNGWLSFMYPRLLLAQELLSKDGVIFISIDDNEQANLKLLCDDVFGEDNFVGTLKWKKKKQPSFLASIADVMEYIHVYAKNRANVKKLCVEESKDFNKPIINASNKISERIFKKGILVKSKTDFIKAGVYQNKTMSIEFLDDVHIEKGIVLNNFRAKAKFRTSQDMIDKYLNDGLIFITKNCGLRREIGKDEQGTKKAITDLLLNWGQNQDATKELKHLFGVKNDENIFSNPKPILLVKNLVKSISTKPNDIILDFFAGSGTTGQAVMQLNAEDGGSRRFILCQIDEPIKEDKPAYEFCVENGLQPVISSITIERLKRAGAKIAKDIATENAKTGVFDEHKKQVPDIGFKVFDTVAAPCLELEGEQITIAHTDTDALSRVYNMIFSVGIDSPSQVPDMVQEDCIYKIGTNYYLCNSQKISKEQFAELLKTGNVFVDGWTASLNATLQHYKENIKIVF